MSEGRAHNNFDALRLMAAGAVILAHSVQITYGSDERELVWRFSGGQTNAGALAVYVFFAISGYLITASFLHSSRASDFVVARLLRLVPALAVVLVLLAFAAGPMVTTMPIGQYLRHTDVYVFVCRNVLYPYGGSLPGVFQGNPMRGVIDGSLWTLRPELGCYLGVFCLGLSGWLRAWRVLAFYICGVLAVALLAANVKMTLVCVFLGGSVIYLWQPPLWGWLAGICAAGWTVSLATGWEPLGTAAFAPYLVIYLALSPIIRLPKLARFGDLSYGTYIYAYPVQQIIVERMGAAAAWYWTFVLAVPIVFLLAFLSWHLIEAPALSMKKRLQRVVGGRKADIRAASVAANQPMTQSVAS